MSHNAHIILYWHLRTLQAREEKRWLRYEFFRQWHEDELRAAGLID